MASSSSPGPILLAPAGNFECARAAVANGADAIYFGLPAFNARMRADNFTAQDLPELMDFLHDHGVKGFVTFNTLIFTSELESAAEQLRTVYEAGVDAIIVQDVGLAKMAREIVPGLGLHASTQMTITSPEALAFLDEAFHLDTAVIARENSLKEIHLFRTAGNTVPLETFVHGALCVAYSGQCLTSESLGQRSANRGECAQACRMPYDLYVDGLHRDLGDKRYLLSPQDLAGVDVVPQLIEEGISCFKIEGRLKSPEYVAAVTSLYRKAVDAALENSAGKAVDAEDRYQLEMTFSRGLHSGWLEGIDNKKLVHARFGKKRGAYVGRIADTGKDWVTLKHFAVPLKKGDGLVVDTGGDTNHEQGGRIFDIRDKKILFQRGKLDTRKFRKGDRIWKTDDPALTKKLRQSWSGNLDHLRKKNRLRWKVGGRAGEPLKVTDLDSGIQMDSSVPLEEAKKRPLSHDFLFEKLNRLGNTDFVLSSLDSSGLAEDVILPVSEINRLRRDLVEQLGTGPGKVEKSSSGVSVKDLLPAIDSKPVHNPLRVLCRTEEQIQAAVECGIGQIYIDLEDVRRYKEVVPRLRSEAPDSRIFLATPRIQKAGEAGLFRVVAKAKPDGVLVRNPGGVKWFRENTDLAMVGDFSLNVANPVSADFYMGYGFENLTVSYDLNIQQIIDLLGKVPDHWFELTLHQHMPMFHMEHCVFCSFLSDGTDFTNCGRPCDEHEVEMQDRVGQKHILKADVGCRNTLFNGRAQTGARYFQELRRAGLQAWRIELLNESRPEAMNLIGKYQALMNDEAEGADLWRSLKAESKLGVVEGTLDTVK